MRVEDVHVARRTEALHLHAGGHIDLQPVGVVIVGAPEVGGALLRRAVPREFPASVQRLRVGRLRQLLGQRVRDAGERIAVRARGAAVDLGHALVLPVAVAAPQCLDARALGLEDVARLRAFLQVDAVERERRRREALHEVRKCAHGLERPRRVAAVNRDDVVLEAHEPGGLRGPGLSGDEDVAAHRRGVGRALQPHARALRDVLDELRDRRAHLRRLVRPDHHARLARGVRQLERPEVQPRRLNGAYARPNRPAPAGDRQTETDNPTRLHLNAPLLFSSVHHPVGATAAIPGEPPKNGTRPASRR